MISSREVLSFLNGIPEGSISTRCFMSVSEPHPTGSIEEIDSRLLNALASLNHVGMAINRMGVGGAADEKAALQLIVESAIQVVPGASALIYTYDGRASRFAPESRVSAGILAAGLPGEHPRPDGMGVRAIQQRRLVLSYEELDLSIDPKKIRAGARSVACYPLVVAEEPLGVLYVYLGEERHFSSLELLMLENFVNQAAIALSQIQRLAGVSRDLARKEEELERLRRAGLIISSRLRLEETLEAILQMALEVTNAQYGIFRLIDKAGSTLLTQAVAGADLGHPYVQALSLDSPSISAWVVRNRQSVLIADLTVEPWSTIYYPLDANLKMQSELAVPLISTSGRLLGVLNLESPVKNAFSGDDRMLLQSFATQAVIAIQEVRLMDVLQEIPQMLLTETEDAVLIRLTELACDLLNAPSSSIFLIQDGNLRPRAANGITTAEQSSPLFTQALEQNTTLFVERAHLGEGYLNSEQGSPDWSHAWLVPVTANPERGPVGVFCVYASSTSGGMGGTGGADWERKVLAMLSHFAGMAVFYASHQDEIRKAQEQRAVAEMFAAVGDLATNLLHQLNNKVGTIPVRIQGIQDKCADTLAKDRYLSNNLVEIERSATEAMVAVRQNLSHLHPVQLVPVNLAECVRAAVAAASLGSVIQVNTSGLDGLSEVGGGQQNLKLVFTNLVENAAHAMGGKGTIEITGRESRDWVDILVSDSGPGIPQEMQERIFELNYSNGALTQAGKLGFGLWWVRALMMRLGGAVWVESDGRTGAIFTLRFPCLKE
jgi:GAF domain-containing protein